MSKKTKVKRTKKYINKSVKNNYTHPQLLRHSVEFWMPYINKLGGENFFYKPSDDGMPNFIISKHYCGWDASLAEGGEYVRDVAIRRAEYYNEYMAKIDITADDVHSLFINSICEQYYDEELLFLLTKYAHCFSDEEHWDLITHYWVLQEMNCDGDRQETWNSVFNLRPRISKLVDELPETFTAYRAGNENGFSWTLSFETAEWFKNRFSDYYETEIHQREFKREDAIFYTNSRNEQEVVIAC